ncbi:unnamed protein product [Cylicocyclus nassatus]|uniref:Uncharacterized protein n=1 Tax=Cylicocyclus nassatus TaxID=53992 RepID=A0AA36HC43_CYLNA|nr:unnamed protein product [Cylicocyclus nassatus]
MQALQTITYNKTNKRRMGWAWTPWVQSAGATVTLRCGDKPFHDAKVWLIDAQALPGRMINTLGGPVKPDKFGKLKVEGRAIEATEIEPNLFIEHMCLGVPWNLCLGLPPEFINYGPKPKKYWHIKVELSDDDFMFISRCRSDIYPK